MADTKQIRDTSVAAQTNSVCGHGHLVEFYETDAFLVGTVGAFLVPALRNGDAAIVVATAAHRHKFETALAEAGLDVEAAEREGRYLAFDAAGVLSRFMVAGRPDAVRFREEIGAVLDRASADGRKVRLYGEMVALLWDDGDTASALALEDLWNDLAKTRPFALLCAYPMGSFDDAESAAAFKRVCEQHTTVIPSEGYSLIADPAERMRAVAQLQQETAALHAEVLQLRAQHERAQAGAQRDGAGVQRDEAGVQRDEAGVQRDEAGVQRDEAGVQRDQAGVQRDEAGLQRDQAGVQRDEAGLQRDQAAVQRDQTAEHRDQAAEQRDQAAQQRDEAAERSEAFASAGITTEALSRSALARGEAASDRRQASQDRRAGLSERTEAELDRDIALADRDIALADRDTALADRGAGASERTEAELDRGIALADRGAGASERTEAELDRDTALADRGASAREREDSSHDDLTGVYLRGAGFEALEREIARATRTEQPLVLAFIDVDGLKAVNDSRGHAAGDQMLLEVATAFRARLRAYDLLIRYGGDEFLCAISGLDMADATKRVGLVNVALAEAPERGSVTVGLAQLQPGDSRESLVARADAALYRERGWRRLRGAPAVAAAERPAA